MVRRRPLGAYPELFGHSLLGDRGPGPRSLSLRVTLLGLAAVRARSLARDWRRGLKKYSICVLVVDREKFKNLSNRRKFTMATRDGTPVLQT